MIMGLRILVAILSLLEVCRAYTSAANNPPMLTHASMDVGNIISIVIPESPDENINVEQLTGEFRQQLERIKKKSRASKVEHGLVTLKRVLPEMSREEKRKTLPLIRRILHGRRVGNSGSMKNWTREAQRLEHMSEAGQLVKSHSAGKPEERIFLQNYGEPVNHEVVTTRNVQSSGDKDKYRRVNEEANADRRQEGLPEETIRQNSQIRQEELIHYDEQSRRNDRINDPDDNQSSSKIARSGAPQEWNNQNWEDQSGDPRNNPETSTDHNYKLDRTAHQKDPGNEILQNDNRYDKLGRISELDQQIPSRYPVSRQDATDNTKPYVKDGREYRLTDVAGFINYARENDMNEASNPDCDNVKRNSSGQYMEYEGDRDVVFEKQPLEAMNFARESFRGLQKIIQDPRGHFDRSNASGLENVVSESVDDYPSKKKRGQRFSNDLRRLSSIKANPGYQMERWNIPNYDDRHSVNSSDDIRAPANVYEMLTQKEINPAVGYLQTEQGNFRANFENEPKMAASQNFGNYRGSGRILRIRRALNQEYDKNQKNGTPESASNVTRKNRQDDEDDTREKLDRLIRLLKPAQTTEFIVLDADGSVSHNEKSHEAFTQAAKSQSTVSSTIMEPTPSTSHGVPMVMKSTTYLLHIPTTDDRRIKPIGKS